MTEVAQIETPPVPQELEGGQGTDGVSKISLAVKKALTPEEFNIVTQISINMVQKGLGIKDACLLANYDYDQLRTLKKKFPVVEKLFQMKEVEKKARWISTLHGKASKDAGAAEFLLKSEYPQEYGTQRGKGTDNSSNDVIAAALTLIMESGDNEPLVKESSRHAITVATDGKKSIVKSIKQYLV